MQDIKIESSLVHPVPEDLAAVLTSDLDLLDK
jgi:hypothetical protein